MTIETATNTPPAGSLNIEKMPGYQLLARMGKRVLRPGGRELTDELLAGLEIGQADHVVEFAPGMGATAQLILKRRPAGYVGVERDEHSAARFNATIGDNRYRCIVSSAQTSNLDDGSADVVVGEALLTMQSDNNKQRILDEAYRILRPGGRYGIHELCLQPETLNAETQRNIGGDLSRSIRVGARPLTVPDWRNLVEGAGFKIRLETTVAMALLEPRRMIADEGLLRTARVVFNILRNRQARRRVLTIRRTLRRHADHLTAIGIVATKPGPATEA